MTVKMYLNRKYGAIDSIGIINSLEDKKEIDTYLSTETATNRLIEEYKEHGTIIIAYDFDDTVNAKYPGVTCRKVQDLLRVCSQLPFYMVCYTARCEEKELEEVKTILNHLNIRYDRINEDTYDYMNNYHPKIEVTHKIFYSIFLDDRAGLASAYKTLLDFVYWYLNEYQGGEN
jgi:hypothetical protein